MPVPQVLSGITQSTFPKVLEFIAQFRADPELDERLLQLRSTPDRAAALVAAAPSVARCFTPPPAAVGTRAGWDVPGPVPGAEREGAHRAPPLQSCSRRRCSRAARTFRPTGSARPPKRRTSARLALAQTLPPPLLYARAPV